MVSMREKLGIGGIEVIGVGKAIESVMDLHRDSPGRRASRTGFL